MVSKINKILKAHAILSVAWNMEYKRVVKMPPFDLKPVPNSIKRKVIDSFNDSLTQEGDQLTFATIYNFDLKQANGCG